MYKLLFCNALTQTVIREENFEDISHIAGFINSTEESKNGSLPIYIVDHSQRPIKATYVTKSVIHNGPDSIYKLFFKINSEKITKY